VTVKAVLRAELETAEDVTHAIEVWIAGAEPFEKLKLAQWILGFAEGLKKQENDETKENDHAEGNGS
jgi:hypothetical protein